MMGKASELLKSYGANIMDSMTGESAADRVAVRYKPPTTKLDGTGRLGGAMMIPVNRIVPDPNQPRRQIDPEPLARLAASIQSRGMLQPVRVRWDEGRESFIIVAGERRWRAAQVAGLEKIPAVESSYTDRMEILADQLVENAVREDLTPIEQANAIRHLLDSTGWTQTRVADELGLSKGHVSRLLSLLEIPAEVQQQVSVGNCSIQRAIQIARDGGDAEEIKREAENADRRSRPKMSRRVYAVDGGKVKVELNGAANDSEFESALREALTQATGLV